VFQKRGIELAIIPENLSAVHAISAAIVGMTGSSGCTSPVYDTVVSKQAAFKGRDRERVEERKRYGTQSDERG
jgi:hypothetical protein